MALPDNFYLPPSVTDDRPKPWVCRLCGQRFRTDGSLVRHIENCYGRIEAEVREVVAEHKAEMDNIPDPEWRDYNEGLKRQGLDPEVQYNRGRRSGIRRARES